MKSLLIIGVLVVAALGGGGWWYQKIHSRPAVTFRLAEVKRGDLLESIGATGTAEPEEVVDVGAQVAGQILSFGEDPYNKGKVVDYRTKVEVGTVLARIDTTLYDSQVDSAKAMLDQAKANLLKAQADMGQMKAKLVQAQRDWDRAQKLGPSEALAQSDYDMYQANFETAKANVADEDAVIVQCQAAVTAADASLKYAQKNVEYCTIASPVKGEIIDRRVNVGETVVSSLDSPSLFLIAKDLTRMQVWASVNEADIGNIYPGQPVTFNVDAYSGRVFTGEVSKVRLNATMTSNVVTYTVEINTENKDGKLLPYLTCNVQFELAHKDNTLMVPNTALRYMPEAQLVAADAQAAYAELIKPRADRTTASAPAASRPSAGGESHGGRHGQGHVKHGVVWVVDDSGYLRPVKVTPGITDGINTAVEGDIQEGAQVVVGEISSDADSGGTNPFAPQMPRRR